MSIPLFLFVEEISSVYPVLFIWTTTIGTGKCDFNFNKKQVNTITFTVIIRKHFLHENDIFYCKSAILIKIVFIQKKLITKEITHDPTVCNLLRLLWLNLRHLCSRRRQQRNNHLRLPQCEAFQNILNYCVN